MLKRWVDSLFLGTWHLPDGSVFTCTPEDRDYYFSRSKEMIAAGIPVPVCYEHQPEIGLSSQPKKKKCHHQRMEEWTARTIGHCHDVRIGDEGQLQFEVDADSEEDFKAMKRIKYCSPEIRTNVIDTRTGIRFSGPSICHLAFTGRPVQATGKPHVRLSDSPAVNLSRASVTVRLSLASYEPSTKGLSMATGHQLRDIGTAAHDAAMAAHALHRPNLDAAGLSAHAKQTSHLAAKWHGHETFGKHGHEMAHAAHCMAAKFHEKEGRPKVADAHRAAAKAHKAAADAHHDSAGTSKGTTSMSAAKKSKDDDAPDDLDLETGDDDGAGDDVSVGATDLDGDGDMDAAITPPPDAAAPLPNAAGDSAEELKAIMELENEIKELGIEFHTSASADLLTHLQHLITALKTHKSTKAGGVSADPDPNQNDPDPSTQPPQEPEVAENSLPIMMSQDTEKLASVLTTKVLKDKLNGLAPRINSLHKDGYIDDATCKELLSQAGTVKLSADSLDPETGEVKPFSLEMEVTVYEKQRKRAGGKKGPFAKAPQPGKGFDKDRPISSTVQLSNADEVAVESPYADGDEETSRKAGEAAGDYLIGLAGVPTHN